MCFRYKSWMLEYSLYHHLDMYCIILIYIYSRMNKISCYKHVSFFWNIEFKHRFQFVRDISITRVLIFYLNDNFINYKYRNSLTFLYYMNQNLYPVTNISISSQKHIFFSYPLKITNTLEVFLKLTKKVIIQRVYYDKDRYFIFLISNTLRVEVGYLSYRFWLT